MEINNYQHVRIDKSGDMAVFGHTDTKLTWAIRGYHQLNNSKESVTILDAGCSIGGIGLSLLHRFNCLVTLNNVTKSELDIARQLIGEMEREKQGKVTLTSLNLMDLDFQYDLTLYFAVVHHVLRSCEIDEILRHIRKQTGQVCVIEVPLQGDALLNNIVSASNISDPWVTRFQCLSSVEAFLDTLSAANFSVLEHMEIVYGSGDLKRHVFIAK